MIIFVIFQLYTDRKAFYAKVKLWTNSAAYSDTVGDVFATVIAVVLYNI